MLRRNLELKACCASLALARQRLQPLAPRPGGSESQIDTYFRVQHGRLKLREIEGRGACLIGYQRPDEVAARLSAYHLVPVPDAAPLKAALTAALGVRGEVRKCREILHWHNVRVHLDEVAQLGTFLEFEAVLGPDDELAVARARLEELSQLLEIAPGDRLAVSYSDLLGL
ncbi:MAG: class IV adenylate cyclase [Planctomycetia bacterium]|nr:class IV adenylate cyclase [Planctomycetia bacterium]